MVVDEMKWQEMFSYFMQTLCRKHASTNMKLLDFLNFIQPELLVPFLAFIVLASYMKVNRSHSVCTNSIFAINSSIYDRIYAKLKVFDGWRV